MKKPFAVLAVAGFVAAYASSSTAFLNTLSDCLNPGAFLLILAYAGILVLARYSPGQCMYRLLVLRSPHRHSACEVRKALDWAYYVGTRVLFAGLIFTLTDVARVLADGRGFVEAAAALTMTLLAALYGLAMYLAIARGCAAALPMAAAVPQAA